jgi:DNA damage-inducible protein 1
LMITVTVVDEFGHVWASQLRPELDLNSLKVMVCAEFGLAANETILAKDGEPFPDELMSLTEAGIKDQDMLACLHSDRLQFSGFGGSQQTSPSSIQSVPQQQTGRPDFDASARKLLESCRNDRHKRLQYMNTWKEMGQAIEAGDLKIISGLLEQDFLKREEEKRKIQNAFLNPNNPESQKIIEGVKKQQRIDESLERCMEENPEMFGTVIMLYINCTINGQKIKAFVDSGAQMTIMSKDCAIQCGIMDMIDKRFSGVAQGVGTQRILGRIHCGTIQIGQDILSTTFSVLEDQPMGLIIGLDLLKRHQCNVDLKGNRLMIGTTGNSTQFLPESELPKHARLTQVPSTTTFNSSDITKAIEASLADPTSMASSSSGNSNRGPLPPTPPELGRKIEALKETIGCTDSYAKELLEETDWDPDAAALKFLTSAIARNPYPAGASRPPQRKRSRPSME